jgi:hypothetical protein
MNSKPKASLKSLAWNDFIGMNSLMFPSVFLIMAILFRFFDKEKSIFLFKIELIVSVVGIIVFIIRYQNIKWYFDNGKRIQGHIRGFWSYRGDRGRVYFEYQINDEIIRNSVAIHRSKKVNSFRKDDKVTILINKNNPLKAILLDIYV